MFLLLILFVLLVLSVLYWSTKKFAQNGEPLELPPMIGWSLLLVAAALNMFVYNVDFGIGYGLFGVCVFIAILLSFPAKKRTGTAWFLAATGMVSCLLFGVRANEFVQMVNACAALVCMAGLLMLRSLETVRWHGLWLVKMKAAFLGHLLHHPLSHTSWRRSSSSGGLLLTVLKTVGLTFIVLLFFSLILSEADPVFGKLIETVRDQTIGRVMVSAVALLFLLFALSVHVSKKLQERVPQLTIVSFMELFIPAFSLALLFGLFLGVQAKYLFGTHADFQVLDLTYAEYVRRGFVELLVASFAGSVISYILILKQHALTNAAHILKLKWVNGVLLLELMLLLASAAKRDWMYVETYGLTRVRLIGGIFLVWLLGIILLLLALNMIRAMQERRLIAGIAGLSVLTVVVLNAWNIDRTIALADPPRDLTVDNVYVSELSSDAVEGWLAAVSRMQEQYQSLRTHTSFTDEEKRRLAHMKITLHELFIRFADVSADAPWQEWNLSREYARRRIGNDTTDLAHCLSAGIRKLQSDTQTDLREMEYDRLYDYESPFLFQNHSYEPESLGMIPLIAMDTFGAYAFPSCERVGSMMVP